MKDFIQGCLQINEAQRFDWVKIFLHPIFKGLFTKNIEALKKGEHILGYVMRSFRMNFNLHKIDIAKELLKLKK